MHRKTVTAALAVGALAVPAAAQAHVSIHPNVVPTGSFPTLTLRVPNESDTASTTRIAVQLPPGFTSVSTDPPVGWSVTTKTEKLAKPVQTDDGPVDTEVREVDYTGGRIEPGRFAQFPMSVSIDGKPGSTLTFKAVQTYSDGKVTRWIGPEGSDEPAPTVDVSAKNGTLLDVTGGEAGPPPGAGSSQQAPGTGGSQGSSGSSGGGGGSNGLAIAALIVGILGLLAGGAALADRRRGAGPARRA